MNIEEETPKIKHTTIRELELLKDGYEHKELLMRQTASNRARGFEAEMDSGIRNDPEEVVELVLFVAHTPIRGSKRVERIPKELYSKALGALNNN